MGPADPVEVHLLDHGRTSSLVLPAADDRSWRYAYGDWRWYALGEKTPARAVAALSWPTQGALGREELSGSPGEATVRAEVEVEIEEVHSLLVGRAEVAALVARLDELFGRQLETLVINRESGLSFVHHPVPYTFLHSSNRVVAAWLRELGCEVRGAAFLARWRVPREAAGGGLQSPASGTSAAPPRISPQEHR